MRFGECLFAIEDKIGGAELGFDQLRTMWTGHHQLELPAEQVFAQPQQARVTSAEWQRRKRLMRKLRLGGGQQAQRALSR